MRSSSFFPLIASLLFVSLLISLFVLPLGYTYDETCPKCQGDDKITCRNCNGSGICWSCGGDGENILGWCAFCDGTGVCRTCEGKGWYTCGKCGGTGLLVHWMYNLTGATVGISFISVILLVVLFVLSYVVSAFYLSFNEWVYEVRHMGFWFNPSFMTWLFAKHRKRWVKWQIGFSVIPSVCFGVLFFILMTLKQTTPETLSTGAFLSIPIVILFSILFYKDQISRLEE